jgi:hypothetical protein
MLPYVMSAASKLSNGVALTLTDLSKEPAKGLLRVTVGATNVAQLLG